MTVSDVIKLPPMAGAEVWAGHRGLSHAVSSVAVMEQGHTSEVPEDLLRRDHRRSELILSRFTAEQSDEEEQCLNIRKYHAAGYVGAILAYEGILPPELDRKVAQVCDELGFVLIGVPAQMFAHQQGELIRMVLFAAFQEQEKERFFVSTLLDRLANLPAQQRTVPALLRMLSKQLRASVILADQKVDADNIVAWPQTLQGPLREKMPDWVKKMGSGEAIHVTLGESEVLLQRCPNLLDDMNSLRLYFLKYGEPLTKDQLWQAGETVRLFIHIWDRDHGRFVIEELVCAMINDEPLQKTQLARLFHIDVKALNQMWLFIPREKRGADPALQELCREQLSAVSPTLLIGYYGETLAAFTAAQKSAGHQDSGAEALAAQVEEISKNYDILFFDCLADQTDFKQFYGDAVQFVETARKLYPERLILRTADLLLAKACHRLMGDRETFSQYLSILKPLEESSPDLVPTLTAYLLDTPSNMGQTAGLLFIHLNTVKYRLRQIHSLTGFDPGRFPDVYPLYLAVALKRLVSAS